VVPRTIHQIWIGPEPLPEDHRRWIGTWKRHHPNWEHRLWTEDNLPEDPIRPEILERLRAPVERADILRLEILYRHGGVYVDADVECLRPVDDVLGDADFVAVCLKPGRVTNTFIAAAPGHPLLGQALEEVRPLEVYWTLSAPSDALKEVAGPPLLRRLVAEYPDVKLLEPPLFFPQTPEERERALGVHHLARTWHNFTALRAAMGQAERRLEEAKRELARERRRHEATRKRLAKAEGRAGKGRGAMGGIRDRLEALRRRGSA
jgi:inositol phosphorylceramide mannosyltransferase catalytic subunit